LVLPLSVALPLLLMLMLQLLVMKMLLNFRVPLGIFSPPIMYFEAALELVNNFAMPLPILKSQD
jgi:hypothetical protein